MNVYFCAEPDPVPVSPPAGTAKDSEAEGPTERPRGARTDVKELPEELQRLVERMLIEGATFQDTVEAVNERGSERVTRQAVENFFRSNLGLQRSRVERLIKTAQVLKKAFGDPGSLMAELAHAVLLMGLMGLDRGGGRLDVHQALREHKEQEGLQLKKRLVRLKSRKNAQDLKLGYVRLQSDRAKLRLIKGHVTKLYESVEKGDARKALGDETYRQIREIYGIVTQPDLPAEEDPIAEA